METTETRLGVGSFGLPAPRAHTHTSARREDLLAEIRRLANGPDGYPADALIARVAARWGVQKRVVKSDLDVVKWIDRRVEVLGELVQDRGLDTRGRPLAPKLQLQVHYRQEDLT